MNINNQTEYKKPFGTRLLILFTVCMIVVAMAVPVFAADFDYLLPDGYPPISGFDPNNYVYVFGPLSARNSQDRAFVGDGYWQFPIPCTLTYTSSGVITATLHSGYACYAYDGYNWYLSSRGSQSYGTIEVVFDSGSPFVGATIDILNEDGSIYYSAPKLPDLGQEVTGVLPTVLSWIQQTLNALFVEGGALQGLLLLVAVPVAISLLLLGARFIRNVIWGA